MKKYTLKALREMARAGIATDITEWSGEQVKELQRQSLDRIGYSSGIYGLNGGLLENPETGESYVIIGRNTTLFMIF